MKQVNWFDRTFDFHSSQQIFPSIMERLAGTPARLEEKCKTISPATLIKRVENTWTIKENIGHLGDLEPLWQGRLEDILSGKKELRPTDLQNAATSEANHDAVALEELLFRFRQVRKTTVEMLERVGEEQVFMSALHPRLQTPMRLIDLFVFVADHDDHHLARITELTKLSL